MRNQQTINTIVFVAFFTAITFIATSIQVPMPSLIGKPFVHLGNAAALISVLFLRYCKPFYQKKSSHLSTAVPQIDLTVI